MNRLSLASVALDGHIQKIPLSELFMRVYRVVDYIKNVPEMEYADEDIKIINAFLNEKTYNAETAEYLEKNADAQDEAYFAESGEQNANLTKKAVMAFKKARLFMGMLHIHESLNSNNNDIVRNSDVREGLYELLACIERDNQIISHDSHALGIFELLK